VTCNCHYYTCLGHLSQQDKKRNDTISVALPKEAKVSTYNVGANDVFCQKTLPILMSLKGRAHLFQIPIGYRERHWKSITIYNATEVSLQQKNVLMNKYLFINTEKRLKQ